MLVAYLFFIPFCLEFAYQAQDDHLMAVGYIPIPYPDMRRFRPVGLPSRLFPWLQWKISFFFSFGGNPHGIKPAHEEKGRFLVQLSKNRFCVPFPMDSLLF